MKLTESDLRNIVKESVNIILEEYRSIYDIPYISDKSLNAMERAFTNSVKGSDVLSKNVKVLRGEILPNKTYRETLGVYTNTLMPGDVVIEYPDGRQHTLVKK